MITVYWAGLVFLVVITVVVAVYFAMLVIQDLRRPKNMKGGGDDRQPPCSVGCYNHVTHPCEKCGRLQGYLPSKSEGDGEVSDE